MRPCPGTERKGATPYRRTPEQERSRAASEPWRVKYDDPSWRRARQEAIEDSKGRCKGCGVQAFRKAKDGTWVALIPGAGVHHSRKLSRGGSADQPTLVPLCPTCHARADR